MGKLVQVVPDGGWGWVLVFVSFFFHVIVGLVYTVQSIVYVALQNEYGEGKGLTSWILSTFNTVMVLTGPLSAALSVRYGHKVVTFVGGLLMSFGTFISFFANSISYLVLSLGFVAGFGSGLCYVSAISMCAVYFDKKRSIAVGIGTSGLGVATLALPRFVTLLEEEYTWRGLMLILGGIMLNMCAMGLLMRPLAAATTEEELVTLVGDESKEILAPKESNLTLETGQHLGQCDDEEDVCLVSAEVSFFTDRKVDNHTDDNIIGELKVIVTEEENEDGVNSVPCVTSQMSTALNDNLNHTVLKPPASHLSLVSELAKRKNYLFEDAHQKQQPKLKQKSSYSTEQINKKSDNCYFYSVQELSEHQNSNWQLKQQIIDKEGKSLSNLSFMLMGSIFNITTIDSKLNAMLSVSNKISLAQEPSMARRNSDAMSHHEKPVKLNRFGSNPCISFCGHNLKEYAKILMNGKCFLIFVCNFLVNLTYLTPVLYIIDRAVENGIEKDDAVLALSMYGAGNIVGRIFIAIVADIPCVNRTLLYFICVLCCGLTTGSSIFCGSHLALHSLYGFMFGIFIGGYVVLTPVVLVDILGVELVGQSYGLCLVFMGVASITGTPMAGWLFDITGSYQISFPIYGSFLILSSLLVVPLVITSFKGHNQNNIQHNS